MPRRNMPPKRSSARTMPTGRNVGRGTPSVSGPTPLSKGRKRGITKPGRKRGY